MQVLQVGKPFELFYGRNMKGLDGCIFERLKNDDDKGEEYCLVVYMNGMSEKERELLRFGKIRVRVIQEGDFLLTMVKFGSSELVFEISFDPLLYKDGRMDNLINCNMIYVVGIESRDGIIKSLRLVNMPRRLLLRFVSVWGKVIGSRESSSDVKSYDKSCNYSDYSRKYVRWVEDLDKRYSVLDLWGLGEDVGVMGE